MVLLVAVVVVVLGKEENYAGAAAVKTNKRIIHILFVSIWIMCVCAGYIPWM